MSTFIAAAGAAYAWHIRATSNREAQLERLAIENKMAANRADMESVIEETAKRVVREWEVFKSGGIDSNLVDRLIAQRDKENSIIEHILRNNPEIDPTQIQNYIDSLRMILRGEESPSIQWPSNDPDLGITNTNPISPNADPLQVSNVNARNPGAILEDNHSFISDSAAGPSTISSPGPSEGNSLDFGLSMNVPREGFMPNSDTNIFSYFNLPSWSELSLTELGHMFHVLYAILVLIAVLDISMLLYGNYLITRFTIETRFPSLSGVLRFRNKLVHFNIATLLIFLFLFSLFVIFMNYWIYSLSVL